MTALSIKPGRIRICPRSSGDNVPSVTEIIPSSPWRLPISIHELQLTFTVDGPQPGSIKEIEGDEILFVDLLFNLEQVIWWPAEDVVTVHFVVRFEDEELEFRGMSTEGQFRELPLIIAELQERVESRLSKSRYEVQQSRKVLSEQPKIGVAIMSEQSTFSHQAEKHASSNPVSSREISSGEQIIDSTKVGG